MIHTNKRDFPYLSKMEEEKRDEEIIINKICRKFKRSYISSKKKKR